MPPIVAELDKALDKAYEGKTLQEVLDAPVSALAGISDSDARHLEAAFGIKTVGDLGRNRYFALAGVLVALSGHVGERRVAAGEDAESGRPNPGPRPWHALGADVISMSVYTAADASSLEWEELDQAVGNMARLLGYEIEGRLPRVLGSVWDRAFLRRVASSAEARRIAATVEQIAELRLVEKDQAAVTGELASAFERMMKGVESMSSACVVMGNLALIKTPGADGHGTALSWTLSAQEMRVLSEFPEILARPDKFLTALSTAVAVSSQPSDHV